MRVLSPLLLLLLVVVVTVLSASLPQSVPCAGQGCPQPAATSISDGPASEPAANTQSSVEQSGLEQEEEDEDEEEDDDDDDDDDDDAEDIAFDSEAVAGSGDAAEGALVNSSVDGALTQAGSAQGYISPDGVSSSFATLPQGHSTDAVFDGNSGAGSSAGSEQADLSLAVDEVTTHEAVVDVSPSLAPAVTEEVANSLSAAPIDRAPEPNVPVVAEEPAVASVAPAADTSMEPEVEEEDEEEEDDDDDDDEDDDDEDDDEDPSEEVTEQLGNDANTLPSESAVVIPTSEVASHIRKEVETLDGLTAALREVKDAFHALLETPPRFGHETTKDTNSTDPPVDDMSSEEDDTDLTETPNDNDESMATEATDDESESASFLSDAEIEAINALTAALGEVKMAFQSIAALDETPTSEKHAAPKTNSSEDASVGGDDAFKNMEKESDTADDEEHTESAEEDTESSGDDASDPPADAAGPPSEGTVAISDISAKEIRALDSMTAALRHVTAAFHNIERLAKEHRRGSAEEPLSGRTAAVEDTGPPAPREPVAKEVVKQRSEAPEGE